MNMFSSPIVTLKETRTSTAWKISLWKTIQRPLCLLRGWRWKFLLHLFVSTRLVDQLWKWILWVFQSCYVTDLCSIKFNRYQDCLHNLFRQLQQRNRSVIADSPGMRTTCWRHFRLTFSILLVPNVWSVRTGNFAFALLRVSHNNICVKMSWIYSCPLYEPFVCHLMIKQRENHLWIFGVPRNIRKGKKESWTVWVSRPTILNDSLTKDLLKKWCTLMRLHIDIELLYISRHTRVLWSTDGRNFELWLLFMVAIIQDTMTSQS
jgi:hypothetical protein